MKHRCPDCGSELDEIKACGCRDFFCNRCNQLVSKRRLNDPEGQNPGDKMPPVNGVAQESNL